jgi:hypothetical protein
MIWVRAVEKGGLYTGKGLDSGPAQLSAAPPFVEMATRINATIKTINVAHASA